MQIAVFEPDIPQNLGAMLRLGACLGVPVHVIEPCGFPFSPDGKADKRLRRAGMDYVALAEIVHHASWEAFETALRSDNRRLVLLTTGAETDYLDWHFADTDVLLVGRESSGVPDYVQKAADARLRVPMIDQARSLNVVTAAAMVLGEGLRQTAIFGNERL